MCSSSSDSLSATPQRAGCFVACSSFLVWLDSRNSAGVSSQCRDYEKFQMMQEKCGKLFEKVWRRGQGRRQPSKALPSGRSPTQVVVAQPLVYDAATALEAEQMKLPFLAVAVLLAVPFAVHSVYAQNAFTPGQVQFGPAPPFMQPGAQLAVLEGNPMGPSGDYTIRLKMPN